MDHTCKEWRDGFFDAVSDLMRIHYEGNISKACLLWASMACKAFEQFTGERAVFQAGTASWPIVDLTQDDGKKDTHFSYVWDSDSRATQVQMDNLALPELHAWVAIPDRLEVIDLTVGLQAQVCESILGFKPAVEFPAYFWGDASDAEKLGFRYLPHPQAIDLCLTYLLHAPFPFTWYEDELPVEYESKG